MKHFYRVQQEFLHKMTLYHCKLSFSKLLFFRLSNLTKDCHQNKFLKDMNPRYLSSVLSMCQTSKKQPQDSHIIDFSSWCNKFSWTQNNVFCSFSEVEYSGSKKSLFSINMKSWYFNRLISPNNSFNIQPLIPVQWKEFHFFPRKHSFSSLWNWNNRTISDHTQVMLAGRLQGYLWSYKMVTGWIRQRTKVNKRKYSLWYSEICFNSFREVDPYH